MMKGLGCNRYFYILYLAKVAKTTTKKKRGGSVIKVVQCLFHSNSKMAF